MLNRLREHDCRVTSPECVAGLPVFGPGGESTDERVNRDFDPPGLSASEMGETRRMVAGRRYRYRLSVGKDGKSHSVANRPASFQDHLGKWRLKIIWQYTGGHLRLRQKSRPFW